MATNDWREIGENIRNSVQSAIDANDYKNISKDIQKAVEDIADNVRTTITSSISVPNAAQSKEQQELWKKYSGMDHARRSREDVRRSREDIRVPTPTPLTKPNRPRAYAERPRGAVAGPLKAIFGFIIMGVFYLASGISAYVLTLIGTNMAGLSAALFRTGFAALIGVAAMCVGISGVMQYGLVKRFRQYTRLIGNKEYCEIAALAKATQKSQAAVRKDLKKMIKRGMFLEAAFDDKETTLMITENSCLQYRQAMEQLEERKRLEELKPQQIDSPYSEEYRKIRDEGNQYIRRIREANDAIFGEAVSDKLFRLENIMRTIFDEVDKHPETSSELRRFMDYYFPTTMKLVDAYRELDSRSIHGENTLGTKAEIENALDVISDAFEKLLDKLFTERAWDISSDISVMKTMLAQDGLVSK